MNIIKKVVVFVMGLVVIGVVSTTIGAVTQTKTIEKSVTFELLENGELAYNVYDKISKYAIIDEATELIVNIVYMTINNNEPMYIEAYRYNDEIIIDLETDPLFDVNNDNTYTKHDAGNVGDIITITFEPKVIETPVIIKTLLVLIPLILSASLIGYIVVKKGDE